MNESTKAEAWEQSYSRRENFTFVATEELVRFVSRFLRQRVGLDDYKDLHSKEGDRVADFGCGIGRSLIYGLQMGFEMYGVDLSDTAIGLAQEWVSRVYGKRYSDGHIVQGDIRNLPWSDGFMDHGWSDGALDSMTNEIAVAGVAEIARVIKPGGYFYCNLISGDRSDKSPSYVGDELVNTKHEFGTIQSYYDESTIRALFSDSFEFVQLYILEHRNLLQNSHHGRWHMVLKRKNK